MIKPVPGRVVHYFPFDYELNVRFDDDGARVPLAAHVANVYSDREVNLMVIDPTGVPFPKGHVILLQDDDEVPANGGYAAWMDYQRGQAARTEQLELLVARHAPLVAPLGD